MLTKSAPIVALYAAENRPVAYYNQSEPEPLINRDSKTDLVPETGLSKSKQQTEERVIVARADLARSAVAYDNYFERARCAHRRSDWAEALHHAQTSSASAAIGQRPSDN